MKTNTNISSLNSPLPLGEISEGQKGEQKPKLRKTKGKINNNTATTSTNITLLES